jgi:transposase-like protein
MDDMVCPSCGYEMALISNNHPINSFYCHHCKYAYHGHSNRWLVYDKMMEHISYSEEEFLRIIKLKAFW